MKFLLFFILSLLLSSFIIVNCEVSSSVDKALRELYSATNGGQWTVKTNWLEGDACDNSWYGVTCDENSLVTSLILYGNNLSGTIPDSIGDLVDLIDFSLVANKITGSIPSSISSLSNLDTFELSNNLITGSIPDVFDHFSVITTIDLSRNQITGSIPSSFQNLTLLDYLDLQKNVISGTIPEWTLPSLTYLSMRYNLLTGEIPNSIGNSPLLNVLFLNSNHLSGELPEFLQTNPGIPTISLVSNEFDCPLPQWCSEEGNSACIPCVSSLPLTPSPSPISQPSPVPSTSSPSDNNDEDDSGGSSFIFWFFLLILPAIIVVLIVGGVAVYFMWKKRIGIFSKAILFINSDSDGFDIGDEGVSSKSPVDYDGDNANDNQLVDSDDHNA